MKRKIAIVVLCIFALFGILGIAGCSEKAETLAFDKEYYAVRVGETVIPKVLVTPEIPYTLTTAFGGIAEIADGGVKGVSRGITVLTAEAGGLSASVTVEVLAKDGTSNQPGEDKALVLYVVDEGTHNYYTNYIRYGETTPDLILEKNGYDFKGWYTDNTYRTPYDFTVPIQKNVKIYGKYHLVQGVKTPFNYKISDGYLLITGLKYPDVPYTDIEIPEKATVDDVVYDVAGIENNSLKGLKSLVKISMPHVKILGNNALSNCQKLADVTANDDLRYVGAGVLEGSRWFQNEKARRINGYYHGAQLGNCYLYALDSQPSVYLFDNSEATTKVTLFAEEAIKDGTKIYVPHSLLSYYSSHPNLKNFENSIFGY